MSTNVSVVLKAVVQNGLFVTISSEEKGEVYKGQFRLRMYSLKK
jgi:hypothetical protein